MNEIELKEKEQAEARERFCWFHWQNLNDIRDTDGKQTGKQGSGWRHGRCWLHFRNRRTIMFSWNFWTTFCMLAMDADDEDLTLSAAFPPVAFWLSFTSNWWLIHRFWPKTTISRRYGTTPSDPDYEIIDEREIGVSIHGGRVWIRPWTKRNEWFRDDPWWAKGLSFSINPFGPIHQRHEVRCWYRQNNSHYWEPFIGSWERDKKVDHRELFVTSYRYVLKNGTVQERSATIFVERRAWRPRCLQWTGLFEKVRTSIDVTFSDEVGERTGSWKGGTTGCGWDLLPGEDPVTALRRMESVRKF